MTGNLTTLFTSQWCGGTLSRFLALCGMLLIPIASHAQAAGCEQGVVRLPDSTGTVTICSALSAQVPQLARQLTAALKGIGSQEAQIRELTRLVKGLNAVGSGLGTARQGRMLANLSSELTRAEREGGAKQQRTVEELSDQLDALRDQLIGNLGQDRSAAATRQALQGSVGDAISQLEFRSASRQLDEINQRLASLQSDVGEVKAGVASANESLRRIEKAVDPAVAADRCADLECALTNGATVGAIQRLISKGVRLPENELNQNELLKSAALSTQADRLQVLDLILRQGVPPQRLINALITERSRLTTAGRMLADSMFEASRLGESVSGRVYDSISGGDTGLSHWNAVAGCLLRSSRGVSLMELAAMMGDADLYRHLKSLGQALPTRELRCDVQLPSRGKASARLTIESDSMLVRVEPL